MTATTSPPPEPARRINPQEPAHRKNAPGIGPWTVVLVLGLFVAVLGMNAAIGSIQRKQYFETRQTAVYLLRNGNKINTSAQRLQEVNDRDYNLVKDGQAALEAGNLPLFRRLVAQADVFSGEQQSLQDEVQQYKSGFDAALKP